MSSAPPSRFSANVDERKQHQQAREAKRYHYQRLLIYRHQQNQCVVRVQVLEIYKRFVAATKTRVVLLNILRGLDAPTNLIGIVKPIDQSFIWSMVNLQFDTFLKNLWLEVHNLVCEQHKGLVNFFLYFSMYFYGS